MPDIISKLRENPKFHRFLEPVDLSADFRDAATEVQTVWVPWGA